MKNEEKAAVLRQLFADTKDPVLFASIRRAAGLNGVDMHTEGPKFQGIFGGPADVLRSNGKLTMSADRFANLLMAATVKWLEKNDFNPEQYHIEVRGGNVLITMKEEWV
jgi:hypothetical protein